MKPDRALSVAAAGMFLVSLVPPAATLPDRSSLSGTYFLVAGAFGVLDGEFRWFANCFFFTALTIGFFEAHRTRMGTGVALIAFALAASCVVLPPSVVVGAGSYSSVHASLDVGGYLWIAAQAAILLAVLKKQRKENIA